MASDFQYGPRYEWSVVEQQLLIGAFFWGYFITTLPGGILSEWFGGRCVVGFALLLSGLLTAVTPIAAEISFWAVYSVRVITGLLNVSKLWHLNRLFDSGSCDLIATINL